MPNWAYTSMNFRGPTHSIEEWHEHLMMAKMENDSIESDFGAEWLGKIAIHFGYRHSDLPCRGRIDEMGEIAKISDEKSEFEIRYESAWYSCYEVFDHILETHYPNIEYVYVSEECGNEYYVNTDREGTIYNDRYMLYFDIPEEYEKYFEPGNFHFVDKTRQNTINRLKEAFPEATANEKMGSINALADLITEFLEEKYPNDSYSVSYYQYNYNEEGN